MKILTPTSAPLPRPASPTTNGRSSRAWRNASSPAEARVDELEAQLTEPDVAADHEKLHEAYEAHREAQAELEHLFARWEELERKSLEK